MIYCVRFDAVRAHLIDLGFEEIGSEPDFVAFERPDGAQLTIRPPNIQGHLPEILVNDAFNAAGLAPPAWDVFWCD